jgi:outer membrane immunogenic protein
MKVFLCRGVAVPVLLLAGVGGGRAADLPYLKAPVAAQTAYRWTGCYLGVQAGGGTQNDTLVRFSNGGGIIGGQAGCDYQLGQIVVGLEGEAVWSSVRSRAVSGPLDAPETNEVIGRNRWSADLSARAGVAMGRALIYGKAGIATGRFEFSANDTFGHFQSGSGSLSGPLFGLGIEYALAPNWSAKLEYDHVDYLSRSLAFNSSNGPFQQSAAAQTNIVKAGINYRFGGLEPAMVDLGAGAPFDKGPVYKAPAAMAYDWTGCYAGAHAGGGVLSDSFAFNLNGSGGIFGGQIGCNVQRGQLVFGLEGEAAWSGLGYSFNSANAGGSGGITGRNRWSADLAGRAGVAVGRALVYGKVGVAQGAFAISESSSDRVFDQNASGVLTGVVFGGGLEYAFAPNWSVKLEYDYVGYLGRALSFNTVARAPFDFTVSAETNIVKAGVNYRLGGSDRPFAAAPASLPAATYQWSGCYAGIHGGGGLLNDPFVDIFGLEGSEGGGGGLIGGQAGCNLQTGQIVWGVEGEAAWSSLKNNVLFNVQNTAAFGMGSSFAFSSHNRWDADVAARAGVAVGQALIYGKVGVASGRFELSENFAKNDGSSGSFQNGSATLTGVLFAAGIEYAFAPNWSAKLEYNRIDYLTPAVQLFSGGTNVNSNTETAVVNVAKLGINYHFSTGLGPVAKY